MSRSKMLRAWWSVLLLLTLFVTPLTSRAEEGRTASEITRNFMRGVEQFNAQVVQGQSLDLSAFPVTNIQVSIGEDNSLTIKGVLDKAKFQLTFPPEWNAQFVFFAHGYVIPGTPNGLELPKLSPATSGILKAAYSQGFAYGFSAYSKDGYAVENGTNSTIRLKQLADYAGSTRNYIVGESMGGNITMALVEKYPQDFAGALPYCGVVAGWQEEIRAIQDFRVTYDYFTKPLGAPFALPGDALNLPPEFTTEAINNSVGALFTVAAKDPGVAKLIGQISKVSGINPDPITYITLLYSMAYGQSDFLATAGGNSYNNLDKRYFGSDDDDTLNAGVQRFGAVPAAVDYIQAHYSPLGKFSTKTLSIHNTIDPLVPYELEGILRERVKAQDNLANFAQQTVDPKPINLADLANSGPAHCYFSEAEFNFAWSQLRNWVENGVYPADGLNITKK